ncbi:primary cilium assembly protein FAM149B1 isoform X1 [Pleurodeles waltl]|uniref:primary cilium assembly protein FAM149B1 isoform X1 n=1 Tax=Pleurodeles waltl TaxID=8319 RepID=UPI0037094426
MISRHRRKQGSQLLQITETSVSEGSSGLFIPTKDAVSSESTVQSYSGFSTDVSSVMSWGFDEYDRVATHRVQQLFKDIDEVLYGEKTDILLKGLKEECQEWSSAFPHLRIRGKQVVIPTDDGYGWYTNSLYKSSDAPTVGQARKNELTELNILGTKAPFSVTTACEGNIPGKPHPGISPVVHIEEEEGGEDVNMSEGIMEEYLAFDCRDIEEELYEANLALSFDKLNLGRPPISPFNCMSNALLAYLFDDVWREVVGCMEGLIRKHWEKSLSVAEARGLFIETTNVEPLSPFQQYESLPIPLPRMPLSKMHPSTLSMAARSQTASTGPQWNLNSIMTIQGIPLQHRNLSLIDKSHDLDENPQLRPTSGAMISSRPWLGHPQEHSTSSLTHSSQTNRRRNPPRILHPINSNSSSRSGTPRMDDVVRGTHLATASDQLTPSPVPFSRNHLLPPIGTTSDLERPSTSGSQRHTPDSHFRSIMDHSNQRILRRGSPGTDSINIGVTGISLGKSSSRMTSSSLHPQGISKVEEQKEDHPLLGPSLHGSVKSQSRGGSLTRSRHGI